MICVPMTSCDEGASGRHENLSLKKETRMATNSDNFALNNWKLTLPVDKDGTYIGEALEIYNLTGFESPYFYDAPDGAMVFKATYDGATTSGSSYPRSELREMINGRPAAWKVSEGGVMTATLKVDQVPTLSTGATGRVIVGQIHGKEEELIRLYWDKNTVYFMNDQAGPDNKMLKYTFANSSGMAPLINLGEQFSYKIDAKGNTLKVDIYADGQVYTAVSPINDVWQTDTFYFKAGIYLGVNENNGTGTGQVSFYGLDYGHTEGSGLGGLPGYTPTVPTTPTVPEVPTTPTTPTTSTITGTSNSETLNGTANADTIKAGAGNDVVYGKDGNDIIYGEDGSDKLWGDNGNDTLIGGAGIDFLYGGAGDDVINGGAGADEAKGGTGRDTFIVGRGDGALTIADFAMGASSDYLVLTGYTATELNAMKFIVSGGDVIMTLSDGATVKFEDVRLTDLMRVPFKADIGGVMTTFMPGVPIIQETQTNTAPTEPEVPVVDTPSVPEVPVLPLPTLEGTASDNTLRGSDRLADVIMGHDGNDTLYGDDYNDKLYGGNGNDTLYGEDDADTLYGGAGNDILYGGSGSDILYGGLGQDHLYGGGGMDVFVFDQLPDIHDVIHGFSAREDKIDLDALLGANGMASIQKDASGVSGLYVDADGAGSGAKVLVATFDTDVSASVLNTILI